MKRLTHLAAATALALPLAAPAAAQQNCGPRDIVTERLGATYGETFSGGGLQNDEAVFEVWISEADGTWTILMTRADGMSCVMAAGTHWRKALASEAALGIPS